MLHEGPCMSACSATCGIARERTRQKEAVRACARSLVASAERTATPWTLDEIHALAKAMEATLPCRACVVEEESVWVYLVPAVDGQAWVAVREWGEAPPPRERETTLRVGFSCRARYTTLQEARFTGACEGDGYWIEEERMVGVEDRRLQLFVKASQGILRRARVGCLDAAFLTESLEDGAPTLWTVFFEREPMATRVDACIPRDASPPRP